MKITQSVNYYKFVDEFRSVRPSQFSTVALAAMFDYLEQYENDMGEEIELDVIALCCDWREYEDLAEFKEDYPDFDGDSIDDIERDTIVIRIPDTDGFLVQQY